MKKIFFLVTLALCFVSFNLNSQVIAFSEWTFSDSVWDTHSQCNQTIVVNNLMVMADSTKDVVIDSNNKTNGTFLFTKRLKLGGAGVVTPENPYLPIARALAFSVSGPSQITISCLSSSSSSDRQLIVTDGKDSLFTIPAVGVYSDGANNVPMDTFEYTGGPATLYLYSLSSGVNLYYIKATNVVPFSFNEDKKVWNFSDVLWDPYSQFTEPNLVDNLMIKGDSAHYVTIDSNSKVHGDLSFTKRLKLNGSAGFSSDYPFWPFSRAVAFSVSGPSDISIACLSASSSSDRKLIMSNGMYQIAEIPAPGTFTDSLGDNVPMNAFHYSGGPATLYLYSPNSGVNLYYLSATNVAPYQEAPVDSMMQNPVKFNVIVPPGTKQCWVTGNFQGDDWLPMIQMNMVDSDQYSITLYPGMVEVPNNLDLSKMEYKYCSGNDWKYVEKGPNFEELPNRTYNQLDTVKNWNAIYDPAANIGGKYVVFEVEVPFKVDRVYVVGSFDNWDVSNDSLQMVLSKTTDFAKVFSKRVYVPDSTWVEYKYVAGKSWDYVMIQDDNMAYHGNIPDTIHDKVFGFYQYEGGDSKPANWNFSHYPFGPQYPNFMSDVSANGLYIKANYPYNIRVADDYAILGQQKFYQKLMLGGDGAPATDKPYMPQNRALGFTVAGDCQIGLSCASGDSAQARDIIITNGKDLLFTYAAPSMTGVEAPFVIFNYTGPADTLYLYRQGTGGVRLYYLGVTAFNGPAYINPELDYKVEVPAGTKEVWLSGEFNGWNYTWMNQDDSTHFSFHQVGATASMHYNYFCGSDTMYREVNADGSRAPERTWTASDVVAGWANVPPYTTIITDNIEIASAENFVVAIKSESTDHKSVISYQFTYHFDPNMMEYYGYDLINTLSQGGVIEVNDTDWGMLHISFMSKDSIGLNGDLLKLKFKAIGQGETWPWIGDFLFNTEDINDIQTGNVTIVSYMLGDVDNDSRVLAYDAACVLNYSVGKNPISDIAPTPWESWRLKAADVNFDNKVTALDASRILQFSARMMDSFVDQGSASASSGMMKAQSVVNTDVSVSVENNQLVFRSYGNVLGFNLYVQSNYQLLGKPVISDQVSMSAVNITDNVYAIGLANLNPLTDGSIIMAIPFTGIIPGTDMEISAQMIVNAETKDIIEKVVTGNDEYQFNQFKLYPNPASEVLHIDQLMPGSRVVISDMSGRIMYNQLVTSTVEVIQMTSWSKGVYLVNIYDNNNIKKVKFVKE